MNWHQHRFESSGLFAYRISLCGRKHFRLWKLKSQSGKKSWCRDRCQASTADAALLRLDGVYRKSWQSKTRLSLNVKKN